MDKVVVITGGTSGIGQALKHRFEKQGDKVYALSLHNDAMESNFIECDVTNEEQIKNAFELIEKQDGKIDVLINNAGYGHFGATELLPLDAIKKQMDTNFMGVVAVTKYALKLMEKGSKIVNISSACALFPLPYRNIYSASKAAVSSFSQGLKMELRPLGIDVCSICPGDIKTPFIKNRVKVFDTNEKYGDRIKLASDKVESGNDKRMDIDYAVDKIFKIVCKKKYKPEYIIGGKYKFLNFALRFAPKSAYINIVEKHFGGHQKNKNK